MYDMPCPAESGVLVLALNNGNNFQLDYLSATFCTSRVASEAESSQPGDMPREDEIMAMFV
jgi:hypothetical protein